MDILYQFAPSHEHEFIGRIERNNRTAQDKLSCAFSLQNLKDYGYMLWVMLFLANIYREKLLF